MTPIKELGLTIIWLSIISDLLQLELFNLIKLDEEQQNGTKEDEYKTLIKRLDSLESRVHDLEEMLAKYKSIN